MGRIMENHYDFNTIPTTPNYCYRSSAFKEVVMADNKDTKYVPKCRIVLGTQEEATALNNGGATQIVLTRRSRKSDRINPINYSDVTTNNPKEDE